MFAILAIVAGLAAVAAVAGRSEEFPEGFAPPTPPLNAPRPSAGARSLRVTMSGLTMRIQDGPFLSIPQAMATVPKPFQVGLSAVATVDLTHASNSLKSERQRQLFRDAFGAKDWRAVFVDRSGPGGLTT